ncbi:helix-turn-helix transcriptional regulator [Desulfofundulus sp. TPOSR]|jgi:hypothetical protein|uniref:helix-turn-helix domain-containing protein n=1 Tax=Desulfofundulus sp. TPOSR TaxID=2714340 RepID=UPI0014078051|nr:helix-turn-helix transcriptional regulator [Desulfofundulus sp. TPOSR]NHM26331.1 helix-turn-helix transcriptional regulator [Desulfofundulus sp. TPOSR]
MNRIREIRQQKKMTQFELARRTGIHPVNLSKVESGVLRAYPGWRKRIAEALGVTEDEIFPKEK